MNESLIATIDLIRAKTELSLTIKKLNENEILDLLGKELPTINGDLEKLSSPRNIYSALTCFATFTKDLIRKGKLKEAKHCFNLAEKMLLNGNKVVKNAIENVFVFSLSSLFDLANPIGNKMKGLMNKALFNEYKKQSYASGL